MKRDVILQLMIDKRHGNMLGVIPSTYNIGRMFDNKASRFIIKSIDKDLDLRTCNIYLRFISGNVDLGKVIVFPEHRPPFPPFPPFPPLPPVPPPHPILDKNTRNNEELVSTSNLEDNEIKEIIGENYFDKDNEDNYPPFPPLPPHELKYSYDISMMYTKKSKLQVQVILDFKHGGEVRSNIIDFNLQNSLPLDKEFYQNLSYLERLVCDNSIRLMVDPIKRELIIQDELEEELCRVDIDNMLPKEWW